MVVPVHNRKEDFQLEVLRDIYIEQDDSLHSKWHLLHKDLVNRDKDLDNVAQHMLDCLDIRSLSDILRVHTVSMDYLPDLEDSDKMSDDFDQSR